MPRITSQQARGDAGERWFAAQLPKGWFLQKPSTDLGVDGVVVVTEPGLMNGLEFRVQVKTSNVFPRRGPEIVLRGLKLETVRYWFANPTPLLLIAFEDSANVAYFGWHDDAISDPKGQLSSGRSTLSAYIDVHNVLSADGWISIRKRLEEHYTSILRAYYKSEVAGFLVPTLHELATEAKYLFFAHSATYWGKDKRTAAEVAEAERTLIQLEIRTHREVIRTLESLHSRVEPYPRQQTRIANFIEGYRDAVESFIKGFKELASDAPPEQEVMVNTEHMRLLRPALIDGILDLIRDLSQPAKTPDDTPSNPDSSGAAIRA